MTLSSPRVATPGSSPLTFHIVGDAFVDFFCYLEGDWPEQGGDSFLNQPVKAYAGGSSVNTATHLTSLLAATTSNPTTIYDEAGEEEAPISPPNVILQTTLNPQDHYGKILLEHVEHHGLNLVNCRRNETETPVNGNVKSPRSIPSSSASTGHCVAIVSRGERSFMTHRGCVEFFTADHLDVESMVETEEDLFMHVAGFFNMTGFWNGKLRSVLERLRLERQQQRKRSTTISLVTQHDATNQWDGGMDELVPLIDFFIMNELEANKILRRSRGGGGGGDPTSSANDPVSEWVTHFSSLSSRTVFIVTRGADGAVAFRDGERIATLHPAIAVNVIDPTGAGDSFTAGFLYGICSWRRVNDRLCDQHLDWSPDAIKQGLLWGCAVGTSAVTIRGASVPSRLEDILDLYEQQKAKETFTNA